MSNHFYHFRKYRLTVFNAHSLCACSVPFFFCLGVLCHRRGGMVPTSMLQHASNHDVVVLLVALSLSQLSGVWARAQSEKVEGGDTAVTLADIQRLGEANLDDATRSYIASGADQEQTLRENTAAFMRLRFRPKVLVDVSKINTATTVLGRRISFPVGFSPSAAHQIADPVGELGTARVRLPSLLMAIFGSAGSLKGSDDR
nr:uncharacterized protein LOC126538692 [Dermacentor andersoni]